MANHTLREDNIVGEYWTPWVMEEVNNLRKAFLADIRDTLMAKIELADKEWMKEAEEFLRNEWAVDNHTISKQFYEKVVVPRYGVLQVVICWSMPLLSCLTL